MGIHNLFNAREDLLKIVANAFENSIADLSRWHTELLDRMTLDIKGIRPSLLSAESASYLELRALRHFSGMLTLCRLITAVSNNNWRTSNRFGRFFGAMSRCF